MEDVLRVNDQFYVLATSALADDRIRVLKHGNTFAVFDRYGDIQPIGVFGQGLYRQETRFLSRWVLRLDGKRPLLLHSNVNAENPFLSVDLSNLDISRDGHLVVPRGTLHLFRCKFVWDGVCYESLRVLNYGLRPLTISLSFQFDADFADIFEVRGMKRERKGQQHEARTDEAAVILSYDGLDGVRRTTRVECSPKPDYVSAHELEFSVSLEPEQESTLLLTVACEVDGIAARPLPHAQALGQVGEALAMAKLNGCRVSTSSKLFDAWLARSEADLHMMIVGNPEGSYPYGGVPWFNTVFGRDGIITALQTLWMAPWIAKGVLNYLAATQATQVIPEQDAEPGKILHERRSGEMAVLKEVPFACYYGSVDATPLFVMLAGAYYERTHDLETIRGIWPNVELALKWMETHGDVDGDGFVEYARRSEKGLIQQGWKDSHDSIFHADGTLAEPPIALCEVQAYVYAARRAAARLAAALGDPGKALELSKKADALQEQFEKSFWCEDLEMYALALDGRKRPCRVRASNAGHCLFAGIAMPEHAERTARTLMGDSFFSGWGIRTVAVKEGRYNPMSYHNGSVWPHDNSLIARGLARYGFNQLALRILRGLFEASLHFDLHRLPELFCGFHRRPGEGPTLYPVACAPQSWASAAVFLLLEACLGLSIDPLESRVRFTSPVLPDELDEVRIDGLKVGRGSIDLVARHRGDAVSVGVVRQEGDIAVVLSK